MRRTLALLLFAGSAQARPGGGQTYHSSSPSHSSSSSSHSSYTPSHSSYTPSHASSSPSYTPPSYTPPPTHEHMPTTYDPTPVGPPYVPPADPGHVEATGDNFGTFVGVGIGGIAVAMGGMYLYGRRRSPAPTGPEPLPPVSYAPLMELDPEFSPIAFEDFASRLYAAAQLARHAPQALTGAVGPYVGEAARTELLARDPGVQVMAVVVAAVRPTRMDVSGDEVRVDLDFETNLTTAKRNVYAYETWTFVRLRHVTSKPPSRGRTFPCPSCGAPWQDAAMNGQTCASCGQVVDNGRFDWAVQHIVVHRVDAATPNVTDDAPEQGTDDPTVAEDHVQTALRDLAVDDPSIGAIFTRLAEIYHRLNAAYARNDLSQARGVVSDALYDSLKYWTDAYERQGLRNQLDDMRITHQEVARLAVDKYYRAVTIRIWATGKDYVVDGTGKIVRGSKKKERAYSEYWTLIHSTAPVPTRSATGCPNCGAPLEDVNQAGSCPHCDAHVTAGEFDWVLSKIEQDDSYRG